MCGEKISFLSNITDYAEMRICFNFPQHASRHTSISHILLMTHTHSFYFVPCLLINLLLTEQMLTRTISHFILSISAHFLFIVNVCLHQLIRRHALREQNIFFLDGFYPAGLVRHNNESESKYK